MKTEFCCGAVVFTRVQNEIYYLIIQSIKGMYGFPKGHMEQNETERETAIREIFEEVHIKPSFIEGFSAHDEYNLSFDISKRVKYFLGEYSDQKIILKKDELLGASLLSYDCASKILQYDSLRRILHEAHDFLKSIGK